MHKYLALGLALGAAVLTAAVLPRFTADEVVGRSQVIVHGTIQRSWSDWDSNHQYIWTHHEVQVLDAVRGGASRTVVVSEPGGSVDGINQSFSGATPFLDGEEVVLFLYQTPIRYWRTVGGPQGKFTVGRDRRVHAATSDAVLVNPPRRTAVQQTPLTDLEGLSLNEFQTRVRRLAAGHPARSAQ